MARDIPASSIFKGGGGDFCGGKKHEGECYMKKIKVRMITSDTLDDHKLLDHFISQVG